MTPTIKELNNPERFELIAAVSHSRIKDFVLRQVMDDRKIVPYYMVYQTILFLGAMFFLTRSVVLALKGDSNFLFVTLAGILFSLTFLVVIHEMLHGIVLKLAGAPRIRYGMVPGKFIFYAEADQFVLGKKPFAFVALAPLVIIQVLTILGIALWYNQALVYFPLMVMCIHSFFCAGDIALLALFLRFPGREVYTFDSRAEKTSYYYMERSNLSSSSNSADGMQ